MPTPVELFANAPTPGGVGPWVLATLSQAITTIPTSGTVETWPVSQAAPSGLTTTLSQGGQFRVIIDNEIMIVAATANGSSPWNFTRGAEGTPAATHAANSPIYHIVTGGALSAIALAAQQ